MMASTQSTPTLKPDTHHLAAFVILAALAVSGVALILAATRLGAGLADDSYFYISPAREFLKGNGLATNALFPPFLPYVLTGLGILGIDAQAAVRYLNAGLFGLTILFSGIAVQRASGSWGFAVFGGLLVLFSEILINVYSWAMSEPLFIVLFLTAGLLLGEYLAKKKDGLFWLAAVIGALAPLTRYVGVALTAAGAAVLLFWAGRPFSRRLRDALVYGAVTVLPVGVYILYNWLTTAAPFGHRALAASAYDPAFTVNALGAFLNWIFPGRVVKGHEVSLALGSATLLIIAFAWFSRRPVFKTSLARWVRCPGMWIDAGFILANAAVLFSLLFTSGIIGKGESYSNRYLSTIYVPALIVLVSLAAVFWRGAVGRQRAALACIGLLLAASFVYRGADAARTLAKNGAGYASQRWHISETIAYLNQHPDVPVVSTGSYGVYFWTGRLPLTITSFDNVSALHDYLKTNGAYLVIVDSMPPEMYGVDEASLTAGLTLLYRFSEGSIYQAVP